MHFVIIAALGMSEPWLAGARAKYVSIQATMGDGVTVFAAAAAKFGIDQDVQPAYRQLVLDGAANTWTALDNHYDPLNVEGFTDLAYENMRDDETRTPLFAQAIQNQ